MSILGVNNNTISFGSFYEKGITDIFEQIRLVARSFFSSISAPIVHLRNWVMTKMLNGQDVKAFAESQTDQTTFVHEFLSMSAIRSAPNKRKKISGILDKALRSQNLVFIPFVLEGTIRNHIVIIAVDPQKPTIEYYNSQGGKIEEETRELEGCDIKFDEFLRLIKEKCPNYTIESNETEHQKDWVNCGAFVCWFIEQRKTRSFEDIRNTSHQEIDTGAIRIKIDQIKQSIQNQKSAQPIAVNSRDDDFSMD